MDGWMLQLESMLHLFSLVCVVWCSIYAIHTSRIHGKSKRRIHYTAFTRMMRSSSEKHALEITKEK